MDRLTSPCLPVRSSRRGAHPQQSRPHWQSWRIQVLQTLAWQRSSYQYWWVRCHNNLAILCANQFNAVSRLSNEAVSIYALVAITKKKDKENRIESQNFSLKKVGILEDLKTYKESQICFINFLKSRPRRRTTLEC